MSADTVVKTRKGPGMGWLASAPPSVAIEIAATHVTVLALNGSGGERVISGYAIEPLAPGVVTPALNAPNVHDQGALHGAPPVLRRDCRVESVSASGVPDQTVARVID